MKKFLSVILLFALVISMVSGCSKEKTETDLAKDHIDTLFNALKAGDITKASGLVGGEGIPPDDPQSEEFLKLLLSDMKWKFTSGEMKEGKGDLVYSVSSKNIGDLIGVMFSAALGGGVDPEDEKAMMEYLKKSLKDLKPTDKEITFTISKEGTTYTISNIEDILLKITGLDAMEEAFDEKPKESEKKQ